jgi:hypothetical protein
MEEEENGWVVGKTVEDKKRVGVSMKPWRMIKTRIFLGMLTQALEDSVSDPDPDPEWQK